MGTGLKPIIRPVCPVCGLAMRYYVRDNRMHHSFWVLNDASRKHLAEATCEPPKIEVPKIVKFRSSRRLPLSSRKVKREVIHGIRQGKALQAEPTPSRGSLRSVEDSGARTPEAQGALLQQSLQVA